MKITRALTSPFGANTYVVMDTVTNKGVIIDPGGYDDALAKKIKAADVSILYIILTHGHPDHTGGAKGFKKEFPEAKLVACLHEKEMLATGSMFFGDKEGITPDMFVEDGDTLKVGELTLRIIHTPGHSPGGICIYVNDCLFSGDTLFRQSIGRTDFPGASFNTLKRAIHEKLFTLPETTRVFPGHMEETDIGFEKRNNPFV